VPDVAADADPRTGMTLAASEGAGKHVFFSASGTSAAGPLWAALIALADQYAGRHLGFVNPAIYRIGLSASYHQAFHDITAGDNTVTFPHETITGYQASPGWDPVSGWGSPNAQALIPLLARYTSVSVSGAAVEPSGDLAVLDGDQVLPPSRRILKTQLDGTNR
jgi:subtilase family serine protease